MEVPQSCRKSGPILGIRIYGFETLFLLVTSWESFNKALTLPHNFNICKSGVDTNYFMRFLQGFHEK